MSSTPRLPALVALGGALLTACGNGDGSVARPVTALPSATSPSTSAFTSASASAATSPAPDFSPQGAEAFVRALFDDINTGTRTMNSSVGRDRVSPQCPCQQVFRRIDDANAKGQHYEAGIITVEDAFYRGKDAVLVTFSSQETRLINPDGTIAESEGESRRSRQLVTLARTDAGWQVTNVATAV